ncbi:MAG: type II toxin-antitoxin system VapC family toxin [Anaerolineales bacterium]|nr:type II toxin-antitoxin system VapC family toxin [Anaerolineales bacterium]
MIIVDANLVAYLLLKTEKADLAERVFAKDAEWYVPILWRSEVRNIIVNYIRHNLLALPEALDIVEKAHTLFADREYFVSSDHVLELAASSRCTAYDCEYVALAQQFGIPLVTFDKVVVQNFPAVAIFPRDFLNQHLS